MSQKNMKMVMIVAIIFGIAGVGYGWKANNAAQHPSRSDASGGGIAGSQSAPPGQAILIDIANAGGFSEWCKKQGGYEAYELLPNGSRKSLWCNFYSDDLTRDMGTVYPDGTVRQP